MPDAARVVIEHLRSGVPSPEVAAALSGAREPLLQAIERDMAARAGGDTTTAYRAITANYGDGKSHLLNALGLRARERGWLVSTVTVSRESPLDQTERVYRKLAAHTRMPGVGRSGLGPLLDAVAARPEIVERLLAQVWRDLHPKVALALEARVRGHGDPVTVDEDLHGYRHSVADIRRAYQERTGDAPPRVERYLLGEHAFDYFRLVDALVHALDLPGWLLLFDEVEMISSLGRLGRARSYAFMGQVTDGRLLPHTFSVWMLSTNFRNRIVDDFDDPTHLAPWLAQRNREGLSRQIVRPLGALVGAAALAPLGDGELRQTFDAILEAHARALDWRPPLDGATLLARILRRMPERDTKIRQRVRAAVQYLDLLKLYGEEPRLIVRTVAEATAPGPDDDEPPEGLPVQRDWPDA